MTIPTCTGAKGDTLRNFTRHKNWPEDFTLKVQSGSVIFKTTKPFQYFTNISLVSAVAQRSHVHRRQYVRKHNLSQCGIFASPRLKVGTKYIIAHNCCIFHRIPSPWISTSRCHESSAVLLYVSLPSGFLHSVCR